jgi:hypothetical protein
MMGTMEIEVMKSVIDIIDALVAASLRSPTERVCQIIFNALDAKDLARDANGHPRDLFYTTDEQLLTALKVYQQKSQESQPVAQRPFEIVKEFVPILDVGATFKELSDATANLAMASLSEPPRYSCFVPDCPSNHVSKWQICPAKLP